MKTILPEVREFTRDTKPRTNTTRGGRRARHPKTTLPHRPPGPPAADRIVGGAPAGTRALRGWLIPRVPYSGLAYATTGETIITPSSRPGHCVVHLVAVLCSGSCRLVTARVPATHLRLSRSEPTASWHSLLSCSLLHIATLHHRITT